MLHSKKACTFIIPVHKSSLSKCLQILKISTQPIGFPHSFSHPFLFCMHTVKCQSPPPPRFLPVHLLIWSSIASPSGLPPTVSHFNFTLRTIHNHSLFVLLSFLLCQFSTGIDFLLFTFLAPTLGWPSNPGESCETMLLSLLQIMLPNLHRVFAMVQQFPIQLMLCHLDICYSNGSKLFPLSF